jgi:hypothetical protein
MARPGSVFARCGHCAAEYDERAWRTLGIVQRVTTDEVRVLVTVWPVGASIAVRRCDRCGGPIARKQPNQE